MKTIAIPMILLPILSAFIYAVFGYEWWMPINLPEDTIRSLVLLLGHLLVPVAGILLLDE
jgi:uncharacterized sodium:solute symporter family permease YidK